MYINLTLCLSLQEYLLQPKSTKRQVVTPKGSPELQPTDSHIHSEGNTRTLEDCTLILEPGEGHHGHSPECTQCPWICAFLPGPQRQVAVCAGLAGWQGKLVLVLLPLKLHPEHTDFSVSIIPLCYSHRGQIWWRCMLHTAD